MVVSRSCAGRADRGKRLSKKRPRRMAEPLISSLLPSALAAKAAAGGAMHRHPSAGNGQQNKGRQQQAGVQNGNNAVHRSAGGSGAGALRGSGGIHGHAHCHHSRFAPFPDVDRSIAQNVFRCKRKNYHHNKNQPNPQNFRSPGAAPCPEQRRSSDFFHHLPEEKDAAYAASFSLALAGLKGCDTPLAAFRCRCPRFCSAPFSARTSR